MPKKPQPRKATVEDLTQEVQRLQLVLDRIPSTPDMTPDELDDALRDFRKIWEASIFLFYSPDLYVDIHVKYAAAKTPEYQKLMASYKALTEKIDPEGNRKLFENWTLIRNEKEWAAYKRKLNYPQPYHLFSKPEWDISDSPTQYPCLALPTPSDSDMGGDTVYMFFVYRSDAEKLWETRNHEDA